MKECPKCGMMSAEDIKFCEKCGERLDRLVRLVPLQEETLSTDSGLNIGDKNVVAGDVVGHHEELNVTGNATIIKNADETLQIRQCATCGKASKVIDGYVCPGCDKWVCSDHYDEDRKMCAICASSSVQTAEQEYSHKVATVFDDKKIDNAERDELDRLARKLRISADRARELEENYKAQLAAQIDVMGRREQRRFDAACKSLFGECDAKASLELLQPLYSAFRDNVDVRRLYLLALRDVDPEQAMECIRSIRFDDINKFLVHIDLLARSNEFVKAERVLKHAELAFGADNPALIAKDAELSLDQFISSRQSFCLEDAQELVTHIRETDDPMFSFVRDYLRYCEGDHSALSDGAQQCFDAGQTAYWHKSKLSWLQETSFSSLDVDQIMDSDRIGETASSRGLSSEIDAYIAHVRDHRGDVSFLDEFVDRDFDFWKKSAEEKSPEGMFLTGLLHEYGVTTQKDEKEAYSLYLKAAKCGLAVAMKAVGVCYAAGVGAGQDILEGYYWLEKAGEAGLPDGYVLEGQVAGLQQGDLQRALICFELVRNCGIPQLLVDVGDLLGQLKNNNPSIENVPSGTMWYVEASIMGSPVAERNLKSICEVDGLLSLNEHARNWLWHLQWVARVETPIALLYKYAQKIEGPVELAAAHKFWKWASSSGDIKKAGLILANYLHQASDVPPDSYIEIYQWAKNLSDLKGLKSKTLFTAKFYKQLPTNGFQLFLKTFEWIVDKKEYEKDVELAEFVLELTSIEHFSFSYYVDIFSWVESIDDEDEEYEEDELSKEICACIYPSYFSLFQKKYNDVLKNLPNDCNRDENFREIKYYSKFDVVCLILRDPRYMINKNSSLKFCGECGSEISGGKFCGQCGNPV